MSQIGALYLCTDGSININVNWIVWDLPECYALAEYNMAAAPSVAGY